MAYDAQITRNSPTAILFLIDLSGSMDNAFGGQPDSRKADGVADVTNRLLYELGLRCGKGEEVRDYFHVGVVGYGERVGPAFGGRLAGRELAPISEVAYHPLRVEDREVMKPDGAGGVVAQKLKFPVWFEPVADGGTPMVEALGLAHRVLSGFVAKFPDSYPPTVLNITDGEATDGDPEPAAEALRSLATNDGNVLLFNAHISDQDVPPVEFPSEEKNLPNEAARRLFRMSSQLPSIRNAAVKEKYRIGPDTRGFVFNGDLVAVVKFVEIGTRNH
jgi:hypothetical protein